MRFLLVVWAARLFCVRVISARALEFACHTAACRPPTSGGTGGSNPGAPAKTRKVTHSERVSGLGNSTYNRSEFGDSVRAAIAADPLLSKRRTFAEIKESMADAHNATIAAASDDMLERMRSHDRMISVRSSPTAYTSEARDLQYELNNRVRNRLKNGDHLRFMDDQNAVPKDEIDAAIKDLVVARLSKPVTESVDKTKLVKYEGMDFYLGLSVSGASIKRQDASKIDDEMITPEFEAASTRVGKMVLSEINKRQAEKSATAEADFESAMSEIRKLGVDPNDLWVMSINPKTPQAAYKPSAMVEKGLSKMTQEQSDAVSRILSVHGVRDTSRNVHLHNARVAAQQLAYREVMAEIMPMGGVVAGTPGHRPSKTWGASVLSSNEQAVYATSKYPTVWVDASSHKGPVNFKQTKGRAHYRHSDAQVTLDGTVTTAVHEMGHRFEYTVPGLSALETVFHDRRARGYSPESLSKLHPGSGYGRSEMTYEDNFFDSYAGKVYPDRRAYELMTMGMEALTMGKQGSTSRQKSGVAIDEDHAAFLLGALVTLVPG